MAEVAKIDYYYSSVSSNLEIKKQQDRIQNVLDSKKIAYNKIDIAASEDSKAKMRKIVGDEKALAPQLANGDQYCGNFEKFEEAIEGEELEVFLKLK
ncbi:SH3 domain-binding glutamic acid-rich-like protein 3 [Oopsacas minuta]|uniref:SH3 domain-binding glutamic acid-rich-like protein n=1 Tax=Oopsacas minuta TaxID=111878 RepID=A0AAV7K089_9METZ|nr:SH3 domain-binding glutamic acid-rich-like protein 3 [Oopsacas minuta]